MSPEELAAFKARKSELARNFRQNNPGHHSQAWWRRHLRKTYGLTLEAYDAILAAQGGRCPGCGTAINRTLQGRLAVDHDHATGQIRGLLCSGCNLAVGNARDNPSTLRNLADYLERPTVTIPVSPQPSAVPGRKRRTNGQ
jgi:hypothetical protein